MSLSIEKNILAFCNPKSSRLEKPGGRRAYPDRLMLNGRVGNAKVRAPPHGSTSAIPNLLCYDTHQIKEKPDEPLSSMSLL